jgi:hypothetical protein
VPIASSTNTDVELNGTRLTVVANDRGGFEFSICSSSVADRFNQFEREMQNSFDRVIEALLSFEEIREHADNDNDDNIQKATQRVLRRSLELFYYWVNFAPLTRGTSATGYAALLATVLVMGRDIGSMLPAGKQLDWEAIFSTTPEAFVEHVMPWIEGHLSHTAVPVEWIQNSAESSIDIIPSNLYDVEIVFKSLRHVLYAMQLP